MNNWLITTEAAKDLSIQYRFIHEDYQTNGWRGIASSMSEVEKLIEEIEADED